MEENEDSAEDSSSSRMKPTEGEISGATDDGASRNVIIFTSGSLLFLFFDVVVACVFLARLRFEECVFFSSSIKRFLLKKFAFEFPLSFADQKLFSDIHLEK